MTTKEVSDRLMTIRDRVVGEIQKRGGVADPWIMNGLIEAYGIGVDEARAEPIITGFDRAVDEPDFSVTLRKVIR
jgi:hypothetical protein